MAGNIYHKWVGSVLTITSDSGTSSSDLKGAKGDDGARGAQGAPGSSVAEDSQKLGGVAAAQYALKNNVPAHNLLDNSDFRNPVNQRGITSQIGGGYGLDRWRADGSGTISVESTGISLTNLSFRQPVPLKAGTYTLAFHLSDGTTLGYVFKFDGSSTLTAINSSWNETTGAYINYYKHATGVVMVQIVVAEGYTKIVEWAALYEGAYDASTLPAYQPKGYAAELAECQRYYYQTWTGSSPVTTAGMKTVEAYSNYGTAMIDLPQEMRANPTITVYDVKDGTTNQVREWVKETVVILNSATVNYRSNKRFSLAGGGNFIKNEHYYFHYSASADL